MANQGIYIDIDGGGINGDSGEGLIINDHGATVTTNAASIDFEGTGVTTSTIGPNVTVFIPGGDTLPLTEPVENNTISTLAALKAITFTTFGTTYPSAVLANGLTDIVRGIVLLAIAPGNFGLILSLGLIENINTTIWTAGTKLYVDATGNLTSIPNGLSIGIVLKQDMTTGIIYIDCVTGISAGDISTSTTGVIIGNGVSSTVGPDVTINVQTANTSQPGLLSAADWNTFNNKEDKIAGNAIVNPDFEIDTSSWNLYNDAGRTAPAYVVAQDITYTAVASGNAGNGINIEYIFHATQSYTTPLVTVVNPSLITVAWYNGPTIANNPTATQLKTAFDAVPGAVAIATSAITGVASNRQYETGSNILGNGGDVSPTDGTGGTVTGVTFTRNTATPLVGVASGDLSKDAANREGTGISTDFIIDSFDKDRTLQVSFAYSGSSGMVLGTNSDVQVFIYDIPNATLLPVTPLQTIAGPVNTAKTFVGIFTATTSINYRLILHIATANAVAWDLLLDNVSVSDIISPTAVTAVRSLVLPEQPISGAVTDHMAVMWRDGSAQWVPATIAGAALPVFGDDVTQLGFATNIVGSVADIYVSGYMDGFSFGPFVGYEQYIDNVAGGISPLPSPFNDMYVVAGMAISSTVLNIRFVTHVDLISNGSGIPLKGGLLSNSAVNDGTGDQVLSVGTNGDVLVANSAATLGLNWAPAVVVASPFTYTTSTRTLSLNSQTANTFLAAPNGSAGVPSFRTIVAADVPTLNQNTTGSAATLTTARTIAGTSFNGSANIALANKFIVQGTTDAGLTNAQFLGALATGIVKNTTTTGVLSIAVAGDFPTLNQSTTGSSASFTGSLVGDVTGTQGATVISAATVTGKLITGYVSGAGTVAATDSILQAIEKLNGNIALKAPLASPVFSGDVNSSTGNVLISTLGKGLQVKTGTNSKIGTAVLVAGTVTVANTSVTANSRIFLTGNTDGGTPGWLRVSAKTVGTSFVITSSSGTDTSTVAWFIVESIP